MKTFKQFVTEMAKPTDEMHSMDFYHGTSNRAAALGIAKEGIKPGAVKQGKGSLAPVAGKAYVTPHIHYAQIYALGGDIAGGKPEHKINHETEPHGYVFKVPGHHLKDVQPDEDSIGQAVHDKTHPWLNHMARQHLTDGQHRKVMDGEYSEWARSGKKLAKKMDDHQKLDLIKHGAHVAHEGTLHPTEVYRIHKDKIPLLKDDGSNFFDHAEKIDPKDI